MALALLPLTASAETLLGVVSERSAPTLAAGAERFHEQYPDHEIVLRTTGQIAEINKGELEALWQRADAVLLTAVFGDAVVPRLTRLARQRPGDRVIIGLSSDRQITRATRMNGERPLAKLDKDALDALTENPDADADPDEHRARLAEEHPEQADWLQARAYWQGQGADNAAGLLAFLAREAGADVEVPEPEPRSPLRYYHDGAIVAADDLDLDPSKPVVTLLDHDTGDRIGEKATLDALCEQVRERDMQCLAVLARWGKASVTAVETLDERLGKAPLAAVVSLQGFVIGGGDGREAATEALVKLDVPVLQGMRLTKRTEAEWRLSPDGIPADSVHYRLSMPEFQGVSQPMVLAASESPRRHELTGIELAVTQPIDEQITAMADRVGNWADLQAKADEDKRIAIVYYNHPPGRHNIGADNLDVPASLITILENLKAAGYEVGEIPEDSEAMVELLQQRGVNLPENSDALAEMHERINTMKPGTYKDWFSDLPAHVRQGVNGGPLAALVPRLKRAIELDRAETAKTILDQTTGDLHHLLEEAEHAAAARALDLLDQLETAAKKSLETGDWSRPDKLVDALRETGVPGLDGWGEPPGWVMTHNNELLVPGLQFGNVYIGPQPPRGWGVREELLHANLAFPPPHQYLAFYHWLDRKFGADAVMHLGRHSTYEFLPGPRAGLTVNDYPSLISRDLPGIYPYIVDGVGEGLQAKRRGLAVIVDHLTPPLQTTPLYDQLLGLRQLVESFESAREGSAARKRSVERLREKLAEADLKSELAAEMAHHGEEGEADHKEGEDKAGSEDTKEAQVDIDAMDDELLVHEVGHYLTDLQEDFMPHGLHVFGQDWDAEAVDMMLASMGDDAGAEARAKLERSPEHEREALLAGLDGDFIPPGPGNDPIRSPEVLPTGRNFHGLNGNLLPTKVGWDLGQRMAAEARQEGGPGNEAVVLWASDTVRNEGAMVAFGLDMLGLKPVWNSRGIVEGLKRQDLGEGRVRRDVVFTTSGLFRDLYGELLVWLDRGTRLALQASSETIRERHPALTVALNSALGPAEELGEPGSEPLDQNRVAAHWVEDTRQALSEGLVPEQAGERSVRRVYGDAPGSYGAGVNRLAERSGSWEERGELADTYLRRLGHAYGAEIQGEASRKGFKRSLKRVERSYLGRASNLYGLMDNNDAFDYLGGLSLAVEELSGEAPANRIVEHANPGNAGIEPLETALLQELRGRYLNPEWIKGNMEHGYAGARTMGSEFMEYLWGWQVTNPQIVDDWAWEEVKKVYIDDAHDLGLDKFLEKGNNAHVKTNMMAIMLVSVQKGFWDADQQTVDQLTKQFGQAVVENGLPGSGHTAPEHPMLDWAADRMPDELAQRFSQRVAKARGETPAAEPTVTTVSEIEPASGEQSPSEQKQQQPDQPAESAQRDQQREKPTAETQNESDKRGEEQEASEQQQSDKDAPEPPWSPYWLLAALALMLVGGGVWGSLRSRA
jgi:cobaltochelatase CobN